MTELYKAGIIEVTEAEDEDFFDVAVHFDGDIFLPSVDFEGKDYALRQAKKLGSGKYVVKLDIYHYRCSA